MEQVVTGCFSNQGSAVSSKINRVLLKRCKDQSSLIAVLLSIPEVERDAPALLDYTPTYQGFIRQKATLTIVVEQPKQEEEVEEEAPQDSFGEIPDILLPSVDRPLCEKLRLPRVEETEGEEQKEMPLENIVAELERRKKKKQDEERARAAAKTGPSTTGPIPKPPHPTASKVLPPPTSPTGKRPHSSTLQTKEAPAEKRQRITAVGSGEGGGGEKDNGTSGLAPAWRPVFVISEKRQVLATDGLGP
ncbi:hypothetical protein RHMOL_Rhmol02G0239800 [Rhododendron molle]|uniref:Uncharacterized protein n=1 Tax=Rhododendron molle TaxID=49168 RepID=A0ACC0PWK9_RHOML|nr:hypothetical protein RHMOL_Rhmol02G0239800 [Rhododendron molle]